MIGAPPFKFDEVNIWSEIKLEIVEKYGAAYTGAFSRHPRLKKLYVDAFRGAGAHSIPIEGLNMRLSTRPPS